MILSLPSPNDSFQIASISLFQEWSQRDSAHHSKPFPNGSQLPSSWNTTLNKIYLLSSYEVMPKNYEFSFLSAFILFSLFTKHVPISNPLHLRWQAPLQHHPFYEALQNPPGRINHSLICETIIFAMYFYDSTEHAQY